MLNKAQTLTNTIENKDIIALKQRKQQALQIAEQCTQILKQEYNAEEVILFGSLRGDSPWHWDSDLDLAVKGISDDVFWNARSKIEKIMPDWLKFDLVTLEQVPLQVRNRILQVNPMPKNKYLALKTHIEDEMLALDKTIEIMNTLLIQQSTIPEIALIPALAGYLADFYTGCERISERVAVTLDGGLPKGSNWHELLLTQMANSGGDNRPPLWDNSLLLELNEYRKFRHIERHLYKIDLQANRVLNLSENILPTFDKIKVAIAIFNQWLENQTKI